MNPQWTKLVTQLPELRPLALAAGEAAMARFRELRAKVEAFQIERDRLPGGGDESQPSDAQAQEIQQELDALSEELRAAPAE